MPRVRFTRAERETIAKLRERHSAEAIYREAQKTYRGPGAPEHGGGDAIAVWVCVEVRRGDHNGKRLSVTEASGLLADEIKASPNPQDEKPLPRLPQELRFGQDRIEAMHRKVEARIKTNPDFAAYASKLFERYIAQTSDGSVLFPLRFKREGMGDAHSVALLRKGKPPHLI